MADITRIEQGVNEIRKDLSTFPRSCGYYLVKVVSLDHARLEDDDAVLTAAFQSLDDHEWPGEELRPTDQRWADYAASENVAAERTIEALIGGASIGHVRETIDRTTATETWRRFRELFSPDARFFVGVALGDATYVRSEGAIIVDEAHAGCLCVVEDD